MEQFFRDVFSASPQNESAHAFFCLAVTHAAGGAMLATLFGPGILVWAALATYLGVQVYFDITKGRSVADSVFDTFITAVGVAIPHPTVWFMLAFLGTLGREMARADPRS